MGDTSRQFVWVALAHSLFTRDKDGTVARARVGQWRRTSPLETLFLNLIQFRGTRLAALEFLLCTLSEGICPHTASVALF